jgi:hypothetical protein
MGNLNAMRSTETRERVSVLTMSSSNRTRVVAGGTGNGTVQRVLLPVKMRVDLRKRFKLAAVAEDKTYAELIEAWLDERDARLERDRRRQVHPFHRPAASAYPGGGV